MNIKQLISIFLLCSLIVTGCLANTSVDTATEKPVAKNNAKATAAKLFSGDLIETFDAGGYTYVQIKTTDGPVWAAGPVTSINKSDHIGFNGNIAMMDFYSKSLERNFETIYFVHAFNINGKSSAAKAAPDPHKNASRKKPVSALKSFNKATDGQTIADVLKNKSILADKTVKVRGQVSKYTANVLGKNWIHIRDSSSQQDLTFTTDASTEIDDVIVVEGLLSLNKKFGYGYTYEVIIEDAKVTIE